MHTSTRGPRAVLVPGRGLRHPWPSRPPRSEPRLPEASSARATPTASSASSRRPGSSVAPASFLCRRASTPRGRWCATSRTRQSCWAPSPARTRPTPARWMPTQTFPKVRDYTKHLDKKALKGARIGYSEEDRGSALFDRALKDLRKQGAELVATDMLNFTEFRGARRDRLHPERVQGIVEQLPRGANQRQAAGANPERHRRLQRRAPEQGEVRAEPAGGIRCNAGSFRVRARFAGRHLRPRRAAIDGTLIANDLDAIVAPGPAYANVSASAGYPTVMVPGGYEKGSNRPLGISFLGSAWEEPKLISFAYDYEQATKLRRPPTDFNADLRKSGC